MPYITAEAVAEKRATIKKAFPGWKISVTRRHHSSIEVAILEAPIKLIEKPNETVNHFYIPDHYSGEAKEALTKINDILSHDTRIISEDSDYGSIPNFYINISIGKWDRPFKFVPLNS